MTGNKDHSRSVVCLNYFLPQLQHLSIQSKPSLVFLAFLHVVAEFCSEGSILLKRENCHFSTTSL